MRGCPSRETINTDDAEIKATNCARVGFSVQNVSRSSPADYIEYDVEKEEKIGDVQVPILETGGPSMFVRGLVPCFY